MNTVADVGRYFAVALLSLGSLSAVVSGDWLAGAIAAGLGSYLFPPFRKRLNFCPSMKLSVPVVLIGFIAFGATLSPAPAAGAAEAAPAPELTPEEREARRQAAIATQLVRLDSMPETAISGRRQAYSVLAELDSTNAVYAERLAHYQALMDAAEAKSREARATEERARQERLAAWGEPPVRSTRDGSYMEVTRYLRRVANDPESIDIENCTTVRAAVNEGWLVGCDYRGRNAFNALIRVSHWFIIRHGQVVEMKDATAYAP